MVATNNHHNPIGIEDTFNFFKEDETAAKSMVKRRNIDLILLCTSRDTPAFNLDKSDWVERINLPEKYSKWSLYRHVRSKNRNQENSQPLTTPTVESKEQSNMN